MSPDTQTAERTLNALQRRRSTPACYPCFKRKVKCLGGRPCEACKERNHPEICHVEETSKGSRRHPKGKVRKLPVAQNNKNGSVDEQSSMSDRPLGSIGSEPSLGDLSTIKFLKNNIDTPQGNNDTLSAMGIGSPGFSISLTTLSGGVDHGNEPAPRRSEILQYYAPFRDLVMPLYPIVPDPVSFELMIGELLRGTDTSPAKLAVAISSLALGAQFAEAKVDGRWEVSQDLIMRATAYLQKANSIFEPSIEAVQALLMIGMCLQNLGMSNGAWNLLGLTYRCAQSLGLHKCTDIDRAGYQGAMLWRAITWQDALMSLRYDRTPLTQKEQDDDPTTHMGPVLQPYHDTMSKVCWVSLNMLHQSTTRRRDPANILSKVAYLENVVASARDHLSPLCSGRTLQHKFEYYAIRFHSSLMMAELCRPGFSLPEAEVDSSQKTIRKKGMHYLFVVVESFLELCVSSNIPFRSWSLMQGAVSCALVLALNDSKHPLSKTQALLRILVKTLKMSDVSSVPLPTSGPERLEIYGVHEKSANLLDSILNRTNSTTTQPGQASAASTMIQENLADATIDENTFDLMFDEYLTWPAELSLFDSTFSDAILQANSYESTYYL